MATLEPAIGPQRPRRDPGDQRAGHVSRRQRRRPSRRRSWSPREHYNRIARLLDGKVPVQLELNVQNRFFDDTLDAFNIVARDPRHRQGRRGGDARRALRLVARGHRRHRQRRRFGGDDGGDAHPEGHGPAACGAPSAWRCGPARNRGCSGRGPTSSSTSATATRWRCKPGHAKLSAYFNMDNGTGAIRGVYLQGNEAVRPVFAAWMEPFRNLGMTTLTIRSTGSHRPRAVRRGRPARLPVHPGSAGVRHALAPHQHGRLRPAAGRGPDEERRDRRVVRLSRRQPRRAAAAQAAAAAAAAPRRGVSTQ